MHFHPAHYCTGALSPLLSHDPVPRWYSQTDRSLPMSLSSLYLQIHLLNFVPACVVIYVPAVLSEAPPSKAATRNTSGTYRWNLPWSTLSEKPVALKQLMKTAVQWQFGSLGVETGNVTLNSLLVLFYYVSIFNNYDIDEKYLSSSGSSWYHMLIVARILLHHRSILARKGQIQIRKVRFLVPLSN